MYEALFQSIKVGKLVVKNRIEAAPSLPLLAASDGAVTRELIEYYRLKARGGAGIVTVGDSAVDSDRAPSHRGQLWIDDDQKIGGLAALAEVIKSGGAVASIELNHAGRQGNPKLHKGRLPLGPSDLASPESGLAASRRARQRFSVEEMGSAQILAVVESFASAASRAQQAGFDMVLLHGGHGWLLSQFVSPLVNRRTDEYGGSLENRARFPIEVISGIRERCGSDLAIEYRFSIEELVPGGLTLEEGIKFAQIISEYVDCVHVSCGMIAEPRTSPHIHVASYLPRGRNIRLAELVKRVVAIPVAVVGGIMDADMAADVVAHGKADIVAMCRALIADPDLPAKVGKNAVRPCLRCNECLARVSTWHPIRCAVNPLVGRELEGRSIVPADTPKKVLIIGGGPAGMQAGLAASGRGHEVCLVEHQDFLGGDLYAASRPWFKNDMQRFLDYLVKATHDSPISLRLGVTATAEIVRAEQPEVLIIAVGAKPQYSQALAAAGPVVFWAGDVAVRPETVRGDVVIVGGGLVGCETALELVSRGHPVVLLHERGRLAEDANPINRSLLLDLVRASGVQIYTEMRVIDVLDGKITAFSQATGPTAYEAETIIAAPAMTPRTATVEELRAATNAPALVIGSCREAGFLLDAVQDGFWAGATV